MSRYHLTLEKYITLFRSASLHLSEAALSTGEIRDIFHSAGRQVHDNFDEVLTSIQNVAQETDVTDTDTSSIAAQARQVLDSMEYDTSIDADVIRSFESVLKKYSSDTDMDPTKITLLLGVILTTQEATLNSDMSDEDTNAFAKRAVEFLSSKVTSTETIINLDQVLSEALPKTHFLQNIRKLAHGLSTKTPDDAIKSPYEIKHGKRTTAKQISKTPSGRVSNIDDTTYEGLIDTWEDWGKPTDSDTIIKILKNAGYTNKQVTQIFKSANVSLEQEKWFNTGKPRNDNIAELASLIFKHGFEKLILKHMSVTGESITESVGYTNADLRQIFIQAANLNSKERENMSETDIVQQVQDWAKDILDTTTSDQEKERLVKEIINIIAKNKNDMDWQSYTSKISDIIYAAKLDANFTKNAVERLHQGKILEYNTYLIITQLLTECDMSWSDLHIRPNKLSNNKIRIEYEVFGKNLLVEDVLREVVALQYIKDNLNK